MNAPPRSGYRGYIVSRPVRGTAFPQRVQNLVVRDFARRHNLAFRLSLTEFAMPGSEMMLEQLLRELDSLEGIILFSAFVLPPDARRRDAILRRVLDAGAILCAALEDLTIRSAADAGALNELVAVSATLPHTPFAGRYEKADEPFVRDANANVLLAAD